MCVQEKKNLKKFPSEIENNYDKKIQISSSWI